LKCKKRRESEPLRGLYPCAICAASGAGAPPRKRGEEVWRRRRGRPATVYHPQLTQGLKEQKDNEERLRRSSFAKKHSATMLGRLKRWLLAMLTLSPTQSDLCGQLRSFCRE
jgi:hypothetical protein